MYNPHEVKAVSKTVTLEKVYMEITFWTAYWSIVGKDNAL